MAQPQNLDRIAANLDDMSVTLDEIKDEVQADGASAIGEKTGKKIDKIQSDIERAADAIDEAVDPEE